ncbi:RrF2 family transcriptional regulator [Streptomyces tsukubensis]|uniref:Transcriptional regulator n=1 Tax=Streptomyces tsukubensis TaxID=83656 RepID=A0A1V3ZZL3_9ACTN|nr:Rrf2 family transcriptional regulator [Streptomyces tsukubensis]OON71949.1 transcriptional regulator [Streptomyces tsukubensis]QFR96898.1 Rrf2 family transcriptional regulator [Streptomyces tsukubensis]
MKLSQGVEWGVHCAVTLAQTAPGVSVSRRTLAERYGLSEAYLAKHLKAMAGAGLLYAMTGPNGGFRLARSPERITVLDVVEAVEGSGPHFVCQEIRQRGTAALAPEHCRERCGVAIAMDEAREAWRSSLRAVTIGDLVARLPAAARAGHARSGGPVTP